MDDEERIKEINTEMMDNVARLVENWGVTGVAGRIYGVLLLSNEPLSMEEISKVSNYSVSSICQQMPFLENVGNVKRTKKPGSKKVYFEAEHDIATVLNKRIQYGLEYAIMPAIKAMEKGIKEYNKLKGNPKLSKNLEKTLLRMEHIRDDLTEIKKFYTNILDISVEKLLKEE